MHPPIRIIWNSLFRYTVMIIIPFPSFFDSMPSKRYFVSPILYARRNLGFPECSSTGKFPRSLYWVNHFMIVILFQNAGHLGLEPRSRALTVRRTNHCANDPCARIFGFLPQTLQVPHPSGRYAYFLFMNCIPHGARTRYLWVKVTALIPFALRDIK